MFKVIFIRAGRNKHWRVPIYVDLHQAETKLDIKVVGTGVVHV